MKLLKVVPLLVMVLVLLGCSFTVSVPTVQTGSTEIFTINEAYPANVASPKLEINMGAGTLNLSSGADALVSGEVHYNVTDWKPTVTQTSSGLTLSQKQTKDIGFPSGDIVNDWTLELGKNPFDLKIAAGAYTGTLDLSGVPLTSLEVSDGASKSTLLFNTPNPSKMSSLVYKTGASQVSIVGIGNANVSDVSFNSGAGAYSLDFTGSLQQDILCSIKTGVSDLKLILPKDAHSIITVTGGLGNVNATGAWNITGSTYETGSGSPTISIQVEMALGNLTLSQK
jgi:hypothetical protein